MKRLIFGAILVGVVILVPGNIEALDVSDFVRIHEPTTWNMEGTATVASETVNLSGTITSQVTNSYFIPNTTAMHFQLLFQGGTYSFSNVMVLKLTEEYLWLEYRISILSWQMSPVDWDEEYYATPAGIIPRQFETDTRYDYIAQLTTGAVSDAIQVGTFETRTTTQGWEVEALRFDFFAEDDHPVTMWMGRGVGFVELDLLMDGGGFPITAHLQLVGDAQTWDPDSGSGQWDDTTNKGDGWRSSDDFGDFWTEGIDAEWVCHNGLGWSYCLRGEGGLKPYVPGIGWMWTNSDLYPIFYVYDLDAWLYYENSGGTPMFFDFESGNWTVLQPGG